VDGEKVAECFRASSKVLNRLAAVKSGAADWGEGKKLGGERQSVGGGRVSGQVIGEKKIR